MIGTPEISRAAAPRSEETTMGIVLIFMHLFRLSDSSEWFRKWRGDVAARGAPLRGLRLLRLARAHRGRTPPRGFRR
jgi:hypothetical protein